MKKPASIPWGRVVETSSRRRRVSVVGALAAVIVVVVFIFMVVFCCFWWLNVGFWILGADTIRKPFGFQKIRKPY